MSRSVYTFGKSYVFNFVLFIAIYSPTGYTFELGLTLSTILGRSATVVVDGATRAGKSTLLFYSDNAIVVSTVS